MGLEPIHLCTCSTLGLWLAGLAENDVSKVGKLCWVFVMVNELVVPGTAVMCVLVAVVVCVH
jgi:hypothetical protein